MLTHMNKIIFLLVPMVFIAFAGCATHTTTGRKFNVADVNRIQKDVTTRQEAIGLFGKPLDITVLSDNEVVWEYWWKQTTSQTTQGSDGPVVTSQGDKKTLELLIKNGVVVNYRYNDDPFWIEKLKGTPQF